MLQKAPPIGAPAEKVENAMGREGPGGKDSARIPSWWGSARGQGVQTDKPSKRILTEAGIRAAEPNPWIPRIISSIIPAMCIDM